MLEIGGGAVLARTLLPVPAFGARKHPPGLTFALAVPDAALDPGAQATAAGYGALVSSVLAAPKRFDLLGVRWAGAPPAGLELRVRRRGGAWSRWVRVSVHGEHAPDSVIAGPGARTSDPIWAGGSDLVQLRFRGRVRGLELHFVNATGTATALDRARAALRPRRRARATTPGAGAAANQPRIVMRTEWDPGNTCQPKATPEIGQVVAGFVHHTESANDYSAEQSAEIVRSICIFHRDTRGWNDMGYNFLVDRFGQIFEGRAGGIGLAVVGAQAQGYNDRTTGVSIIGNFMAAAPPEEAIKGLVALLAWKLALHGVPATGTVTLTSRGGADNRFPPGRAVTLERIPGHRDGDSTDCPGNVLYAELPRIRERVGGRSPSTPATGGLTLNASRAKLVVGEPLVLVGTFNPTGAPPGAAAIALERSTPGGFEQAGAATTAADGSFSATLQPDSSLRLRAHFAGDTQRPEAISSMVTVAVAPRVALSAARTHVRAGGSIPVSATIAPARRGLSLVIERRTKRGWKSAGTGRLRGAGGQFRGSARLRTPGLYRLRAVFRGDARNAKASSPPVLVRASR